jgi:hypothetical protein
MVTRKERPLAFWDIESLSNIFMFAIYFRDFDLEDPKQKDWLMFCYLFDDMKMTPELEAEIADYTFKENQEIDPNKTKILFCDLKDKLKNVMLLNLFSVDNKPAFGKPIDNDFRTINPKINSDMDEDLTMPYLIGYNSVNYDNTMMAYYFNEVWGFDTQGNAKFMPTTAAHMRKFNNLLFQSYKDNMSCALQYKEADIYQNMLRSGMFIDASKVNDKVYKMALKRIEGMLGLDIHEDDDVKGDKPITTKEQLLKLFAYNASDVIKTGIVFDHKAFKAQFNLKKGLIDAYQDLIYDKQGKLRINRLKIDDTSAKFAARVLCPDGFLNDIRAVSFEYPRGSGRNILQETWDWAREKFKDCPHVMTEHIDPIFNYYAQIEGKNFDASEHYDKKYIFDGLPVSDLKSIPAPRTTIPYFDKNGDITGTYVNFGIGGIHGAEFNLPLYLKDMEEYMEKYKDIKYVIDYLETNYTEDELRTLKSKIIIDGVEYKTSKYIGKKKDGTITRKWPKEVKLFQMTPKGGWQLNKKYTYCSDDEVDHEDFTSYYPCMLMQLKAFVNEMLGEDRYTQQFDNKTLYGKYMKDENRSKEEREYYAVLREGTKLILNSASGAADTAYDNSIRMNNVIISMRIIGQLFTWRIGQAQTLEGFKITSTNTDGLYAVCNEETREKCREILERESASIGVAIEPEEMRLISKDANNRIELSLEGKLLSASGGDTACWKGPNPTKALAHPAIIDTLMVKYMAKYGVNEPFSIDRAMDVLTDIKNSTNSLDLLLLYQNMVNSSDGTCRYVFGMIDNKPIRLQHNNRIYAVKVEAAHLYIANGTNKNGNGHNEFADEILKLYDIDPDEYKHTKILKVTKLAPEQNVFIYNKSLHALDETSRQAIINNLDDGFYIELFKDTYSNWCNCSDKENTDQEAEDLARLTDMESEVIL